MIRQTLIVIGAVFLVTYSYSPSSGSGENAVGGPGVVSRAEAPMMKGTTSLSLNVGPSGQTVQLAIADVLSYGGSQPTITAPAGWELIRDDYTQTTRQSLYWHAIAPNDPSTETWTFSDPVDAQGAVLLLDNVALGSPVNMSSGNTGGTAGGLLTAKSIATTRDGELILTFNATDFGACRPTVCTLCDGLKPKLPDNANVVLDHETTALEYWILSNYQSQMGSTEVQVSYAPQFFNWVAAQVAIR
jgi:hypothetical protein